MNVQRTRPAPAHLPERVKIGHSWFRFCPADGLQPACYLSEDRHSWQSFSCGEVVKRVRDQVRSVQGVRP